MKRTSAVLIAALLCGCAGTGQNYRPLVDTQSSRNSGANFEADLFQCQQYATQVADAAQTALAGAIVGALIGAAFGAAIGHGVSRNDMAAFGAASGGVQGAAAGEEGQRSVIRRCLAGRGYSVLS
jgi:outer membrane lipoprotein SlyB